MIDNPEVQFVRMIKSFGIQRARELVDMFAIITDVNSKSNKVMPKADPDPEFDKAELMGKKIAQLCASKNKTGRKLSDKTKRCLIIAQEFMNARNNIPVNSTELYNNVMSKVNIDRRNLIILFSRGSLKGMLLREGPNSNIVSLKAA